MKTNENQKTISDFGQKIGGAKKDIAKLRKNNVSFSSEIILSWTDEERMTEIIKKTVFPKFNYEKLKENGYDRDVIYFIKKVYDALPVKPHYEFIITYNRSVTEIKEEYFNLQKEYISNMNIVKNFFLGIETNVAISKIAFKLLNEVRNNCGRLFVSKKLEDVICKGIYSPKRFQTEAVEKGFLMTEKEKKASEFLIIKYNGENVYDKSVCQEGDCLGIDLNWYSTHFVNDFMQKEFGDIQNWIPNTYFVWNKKENKIYNINLETEEQSHDFINGFVDSLFMINDISKSVTTKTLTKKKSQKPAQLEHIERTGIDYRHGKSVTTDDMLNTFHFRGGEFGNWLTKKSTSKQISDAQANLDMSYDAFMDIAMALDIQTESVSFNGILSIAYGSRGRGNAVAHFEPARAVINLTKMRGAGSLGHEWGHALDYYVAKSVNRLSSFETETRKGLFTNVLQTIKYNGSKKTKYYSDACAIDGSSRKKYWSSDKELFARAFHCYLLDTLKEKGIKSDYLCGTAEQSPIEEHFTYPQGEERKNINHEFDLVLIKLKEMNILK